MKDTDQKRPIRILHVVGGMDTGGVETWLMHVLRRIDRDRYRFDFLTHTTKPCFYDDEIRSLGCRIIPCTHMSQPWRYALNYWRILKEYGPYEVVHSHVHYFSGFVIFLSCCFGIQKRIVHSHLGSSTIDMSVDFWRKLYIRVSKWLVCRYATLGLACSSLAAASLFEKNWENNPERKILYCGIDLEPFKSSVNRDEIRRELKIPADAFVLGHVGRFMEQKNHDFLLEVFAEVARREPKAYLLLVGDGPLRESIKQKAQRFGLLEKIVFAGVRPDVPRLMLGAMDVFVFPSHHEGLPLVLIEAQAAGLPAVISDMITTEVIIVPGLIKSLSLQKDAVIWADCVMTIKNMHVKLTDTCKELENSPFVLSKCLAGLTMYFSHSSSNDGESL